MNETIITKNVADNGTSFASRSSFFSVRGLNAFYGKSHVVQGFDIDIERGEIVSLVGRNGAGRSTALKAVAGSVTTRGSILFEGDELVGLKPFQIARRGIGYVPENRDIFGDLTVRENLILGERKFESRRWTIERVFDLFPRLGERADTAAGVLSGGEQQMLTICRTLMGDPTFVMVDEPTEGLAPMVVGMIAELLKTIANHGVAILLVEQKLNIAMQISQRICVMGHGSIVFEGTPAGLVKNTEIRREWLEV